MTPFLKDNLFFPKYIFRNHSQVELNCMSEQVSAKNFTKYQLRYLVFKSFWRDDSDAQTCGEDDTVETFAS